MDSYAASLRGRAVALQVDRRQVLQEAAGKRGAETFEHSLGRAVRRHGGDYADYLALIGEVREAARSRKIGLRDAAGELAR